MKNILITGWSTGIGYFCAEELRKNGYNAYATYRYKTDGKIDVFFNNRAITSKKSRAKYRVTFPTKLFWFLKRVLGSKSLDWVLRKAG